jgi:hypothetical protein
MSVHSLLRRGPTDRFVALRPHLVELCDGSPCAGMLLALFDFHSAARLTEIERRAEHNEPELPDGLWLTASVAWLGRELYGAFGKAAIRSALDLLTEKRYLQTRPNPGRKFERSTQYILDVERVNAAIDRFLQTDEPESDNRLSEIGQSDLPKSDTHAGASDSAVEPVVEPVKEPTDVEVVWNHYVEALNATRQTLDDKRRTIIRNALKARSVEECKRAIDGLSVSPFHNGDNEQRKKYLGIRYALSGIGKESNDERIDKMVDIADEHGGVVRGGKLPSDHPRIKRWLENVRYALRNRAELTRGREALNALREHGYDVAKLEQAPWVRLIPYEQPRQAA